MRINPEEQTTKITNFITEKFAKAGIKTAIVAVSGGIDSALSLYLTVRALGADNVRPVFLPYHHQSTADSELIATHLNIPENNWTKINIGESVDHIAKMSDAQADRIRLGNIMARVRMIFLYDLAKKFDALVVGTENRSEKYLGYFTRFGDEASDLEPIVHLYKTEVRELVAHLQLPQVFLKKDPSAGLWQDQTDEYELGFTYELADKVFYAVYDQKMTQEEVATREKIDLEQIKKILDRVESQKFKQEVPYHREPGE